MTVEDNVFHRLPTTVRPYHYSISLEPNFTTFIFDGTQDVQLEIKEETDTITLNSLSIDIKSVNFQNVKGEILESKSIQINKSQETATIVFPEKLPVGRTGFLRFEFQGELNDKMKGLYRSKFRSKDGTTKYAAVTQFESTDARRCFPCWDEPMQKATFDITVTVQKGVTALSNMPIKSLTSASETMDTVVFETSPLMSTYLVSLVIGEFDYVEDFTKEGVIVRVYTPKGQKNQGQYALDIATKTLSYYTHYFNIPYPLPKLDLVAVADLAANAMENWGLVTYKELFLLTDSQYTSTSQKQWIASVISHELAHQWFGNLVTMKWWTHLWLKEGCASFVEYLCVAYLFPQYDIWRQFVTETYNKALELDALKNSHPVEVPVENPADIDEIFDVISYCKGASIIRMLHSYIGDDDFKKGMNLYLRRHSYSNTDTLDLWVALEEASEKPISSIMSTWTEQQGFPIVKVSEKDSNNPKNRILSFCQERFLADGSTDTQNYLWKIPITISTSLDASNPIKNLIFDTKTLDIELENVPKDAWVKVNFGTVGFYRTLYSDDLLKLLVSAVENQSLPQLDRLGLLSDLFALSQAGHISVVEVLKFMKAFESDGSYIVWCCIVDILSKIDALLSHLEIHSQFQKFGRSLLRNICNRHSWGPKDDEEFLDTLCRSLILGQMVIFEDEDTIKEARRRFDDHMSKKSFIHGNIRHIVYRAVLTTGDSDTLNTMLKLYRETDLHEEKNKILGVLGSVKDEELLRRVLEFSMSDEVRSQDALYAIVSVALTYKGRCLAWQFVKDNFDMILNKYDGGYILTRFFKYSTHNFVTEERAVEIEKFFEKHPVDGTERTLQQCIETVRLNAAWLSRDQKSLEEFLSTFE